MVHYNPEQLALPTLPPICPKCGSHRTDIVGRSNDSRTVTIRCNSCGARSTVQLDSESFRSDRDDDDYESRDRTHVR